MTRRPPISHKRMAHLGWIRVDPHPWSKCAAEWRHTSGWVLRHCGHPTALWPWFAIDPAHPNACTMTHNGLGFADLEAASTQIGAVLAGELVATSSRCVPGVRRITAREDDLELDPPVNCCVIP